MLLKLKTAWMNSIVTFQQRLQRSWRQSVFILCLHLNGELHWTSLQYWIITRTSTRWTQELFSLETITSHLIHMMDKSYKILSSVFNMVLNGLSLTKIRYLWSDTENVESFIKHFQFVQNSKIKHLLEMNAWDASISMEMF